MMTKTMTETQRKLRTFVVPVISAFAVSLTACGFHESRSLYDNDAGPSQDIRSLTEQEEIQTEIQSGSLEKLITRLDLGLGVDSRLSKGKTLIMEAAVWRQTEIVKLLLSRGADIELLDEDGKSIRDHAFGNTEILRLLPSVVDLETVERLFQLVDASDYRKLKSELDLGLDPNIKNADGDTLLIRAVRKGSRPVVSTLVRYPGISLTERDPLGKTALTVSRELGHLQIEKELLARGATE